VLPDHWLHEEIVDTTKFVFNKTVCFDLSGHHQPKTHNTSHKREIQNAFIFRK
jgi:hypothetical protein